MLTGSRLSCISSTHSWSASSLLCSLDVNRGEELRGSVSFYRAELLFSNREMHVDFVGRLIQPRHHRTTLHGNIALTNTVSRYVNVSIRKCIHIDAAFVVAVRTSNSSE